MNQRLQRTQLARDAIAILAEWFPNTFFVYERNRKPLALHIDHAIALAVDGAITPTEIKLALSYYTRDRGYLFACKAGADRVDLNGHPAGKITPEEAAYARQRLHPTPKSTPPATVTVKARATTTKSERQRVLPVGFASKAILPRKPVDRIRAWRADA